MYIFIKRRGLQALSKKGQLDVERYKKGLEAKEFFLKILNADCLKVAIENPISSRIYETPKHTQEIQPYQFGHPYTKKNKALVERFTAVKSYRHYRADRAICAGRNRKKR